MYHPEIKDDGFVKSPSAALRCILQRTSMYASFLRICAPCIWIFFLCRLIPTFYNDVKGDPS